MASLEVLSGPDAGLQYRLAADRIVVGRSPFCDLVLTAKTVSREHARIGRDAGGYYIEDLGSLNGTYVNNQRVKGPVHLRDEDLIRLFDVVLLFQERETARSGAAPADRGRFDVPLDEANEAPASAAPTATIVHALNAASESRVDRGSAEKLRALLDINRRLGSSLDVEEMLPRILDSVFDVFPQAQRGHILLAKEPGGELVCRAVKQGRGDAGGATTLRAAGGPVAEQVMSQGQAVLLADSSGDQVEDSVLERRALSIICAPLMGPLHKPLGVIQVEADDPQERFDREDLDVLVSVATAAGQSLEHAREHEARLMLERRERELAAAKAVQLSLLPRRQPQVPGYRFHVLYRPADEVGGDYYGYVPLPDGRLAIAVGDVAGKGMSAALLVAQLSSEVRASLLTSDTPAEAMASLNRALSEGGERLVTFVLCVLDPRRHTLVLVNAGHPPPLRRKAGRPAVEELAAAEAGLPLGLDPQWSYCQVEVRLEPGDLVALYTDGISDARDVKEHVYGFARVRQLVASGPGDVEGAAQAVLDDVLHFAGSEPQVDDICLLCFSRELST